MFGSLYIMTVTRDADSTENISIMPSMQTLLVFVHNMVV